MLNFNLDVNEAINILKPLGLFVLGMVIYSVFIFRFYRFLARRDVFKLDLSKYNKAKHPLIEKFIGVILYIIEYVFLFPLFTFFWFGILTILLVFLSKEQTVQTILLISMAVVGAVRITAYYNEDLSKDLAKMLPFALLGIFIIDISYFNFSESFVKLYEIPSLLNMLLYYFIFILLLEFVLRIGYGILKPLLSR